jgi:hypothetical protein
VNSPFLLFNTEPCFFGACSRLGLRAFRGSLIVAAFNAATQRLVGRVVTKSASRPPGGFGTPDPNPRKGAYLAHRTTRNVT